jgi:hypothetical protein
LHEPPTPSGTFHFERRLKRLLDEVGREIVQWTYNRGESTEVSELPARVRLGWSLSASRCCRGVSARRSTIGNVENAISHIVFKIEIPRRLWTSAMTL